MSKDRHRPLRPPKKLWGPDNMVAAPTPLGSLAGYAPIASINGFDGVDTNYSFGVYSIHSTPSATNAVYLFCKIQNGQYVPLYIGKAENLHSRLVGHERMAEGIRLGATHLLVHTPGYGARVHYMEAERRLIAHYDPVLNVQHRIRY